MVLQGAARGAGIGAGVYSTPQEAFVGLQKINAIEPRKELNRTYKEAFERWLAVLTAQMGKV